MAEGRFQGWQALAAVLGGLAAVITALVAVVALVRQNDDGTGAGRVDNPGQTTGAAQITGGTQATGDAPGNADTPLYNGPLRFASRVDFDQDPPDVISNQGLEDLVMVGNNDEKVQVRQGAAVWNGGRLPTRAQCVQTISTSGTTSAFAIDAGVQICFKSRNGRIGYLKFLSRADDMWSVEAIVWRAG